MAEREGFEPSIGLQTLYSLSRGAPSATRPPLQNVERQFNDSVSEVNGFLALTAML